jgi:hypothetical protein
MSWKNKDPFTPAEDVQLLALRLELGSITKTQRIMSHRTIDALRYRHARLSGLESGRKNTKPKAPAVFTLRDCLRCRKPFNSRGAGNRLCEPCGVFANSGDAPNCDTFLAPGITFVQ